MDVRTSSGVELRIVRDFEPMAPVALDQHKVLQVLINLLSNAKKSVAACSRTGKNITLSIRKVGSGQYSRIEFQVVDNGLGIAPEAMTKVFAHGFTTRAGWFEFGLHTCPPMRPEKWGGD